MEEFINTKEDDIKTIANVTKKKKTTITKKVKTNIINRKKQNGAVEKKAAPVKTKARSKPPTKKEKPKQTPSLKRLERQVHLVLMELMRSSESDSVRVAAAKALMDRINKTQEGNDDTQHDEAKERDEAVAEAGALLAKLAASQSSRCARKVAMA